MTHHFIFDTKSFIRTSFLFLDYYNKIDITKYEDEEKKTENKR